MKSVKPHYEDIGYAIFYAVAILLTLSVSMRPSQEGVKQNKTLYGALYWPDSSLPDSTIKKSIKILLESTSIIIAQIPWYGNNSESLEQISWYSTLAQQNGKPLMIALDWQTPERLSTINQVNFSHKPTQKQFIKFVNDAIKQYQPDYFNFGVEANYLAHTSPQQYRAFINLTRQLQAKKHIASPINYGVSLQLDLIRGRHNDWSQSPTNSIPNDFNHLDFIGLSSYPEINNACLSDSLCRFPYFESPQPLSPTIGISETGISSRKNSLLARMNFVQSVLDTDYEFIIWGNLSDLTDSNLWHSHNGLIKTSGTPKPELEIWRQTID